MIEPVFFRRAISPSIGDVAAQSGAKVTEGADLSVIITAVGPLDTAGPGELTFLDNPKYAEQLASTRASAVFVHERYASRVPQGTVALICADPYRAFAQFVGALFPDAMRPASVFGAAGVSPMSYVHPDAKLEAGVVVDPGAVIGPRAAIGAGTIIGPHAVIGADVRIGRDCSIGAGTTIQHTLMGDRVIVHPGTRIGQDGFGFAMGPQGHLKVPQIGRVIIQNDVEIGANTTIDRGANRDTVIGEGTKIDNLVQIGHNVVIGRHCVIVSQVGISGSTVIGDYAAMGGQAGIAGHLKIGMGAQLAAQSGLMNDVPAGEKWGGTPAAPMRDWLRGVAVLQRFAKGNSGSEKG